MLLHCDPGVKLSGTYGIRMSQILFSRERNVAVHRITGRSAGSYSGLNCSVVAMHKSCKVVLMCPRRCCHENLQPPPGVDLVTTALLIMVKLEKKNFSWENAKKMMAKVDAFKEQLEEYRGEDVPEVSLLCMGSARRDRYCI